MYTVGIGLTETDELRGMASPPADLNSFAVDSFDELEGFGQKIFSAICKGNF